MAWGLVAQHVRCAPYLTDYQSINFICLGLSLYLLIQRKPEPLFCKASDYM